jgi:epoxyqueuosine reductase
MDSNMGRALREWAAKRGHRIAWYGGDVVRRAFDRIARLRADGELEAEFFGQFLSWSADPAVLARAETRTLVLVAIPRPAHVVAFEDGSGRRELVLPPTYLRYNSLFDDVLADLSAFTEDRLKLRRISAPLKTIAGLTGFARYGRNNITYVDGFGSAVQLAGFATDTVIPGGAIPPEGAPAALDECRSCRACLRACPTEAIVEDRFLYHGERCLTAFSESEGELPLVFSRLKTPTLIGCLACQESCPANRSRLRFERVTEALSSEETAYILGERGEGPPPARLIEKIRSLGLSDITMGEAGPSPIFRRNLRAVLRNR